MPIAKPSLWGVTSLVLLVGGWVVSVYGENLFRLTRHDAFMGCALIQFVAAVCGVIAAKKQSGLWLVAVLIEGFFWFTSFFYEL